MSRLIYGMMQSLDGYIDGLSGTLELGPPGPTVFRHFVDHVQGVTSILYGRRMYEIMRYWDLDKPDWNQHEREFAQAWRTTPKWVATRSGRSSARTLRWCRAMWSTSLADSKLNTRETSTSRERSLRAPYLLQILWMSTACTFARRYSVLVKHISLVQLVRSVCVAAISSGEMWPC